jgi:hypothetical protein
VRRFLLALLARHRPTTARVLGRVRIKSGEEARGGLHGSRRVGRAAPAVKRPTDDPRLGLARCATWVTLVPHRGPAGGADRDRLLLDDVPSPTPVTHRRPNLPVSMRRLALTLIAALGLAACGGEGATAPVTRPPEVPVTPPAPPEVGTYALQTVDGASVPAVYFLGGDFRFDVTAGSVVLKPDRTFRIALTIRFVGVEGTTETPDQEVETGTYEVSGSTITLRSSAGETITASISSAQLSLRMDGFTFVYRKV